MHIDARTLLHREHVIDGIFINDVSPGFLPEPLPPIVFLHGAYQGYWVYAPWQRYFAAAGWRTLALSLRNHPGSERLDERDFLRLRPEDYVDDVLRVAKWINGPFVLVAHSMGGLIAQKAAERLPQLAALILLASGPPKGLGASRTRDMPAERVSLPDYDQVRRHMFGDIGDAEYAAFHARLVPETPGVINQTGRGRVSVNAERIHVPVLAVDAECDRNHFGPKYARFYRGEHIQVPGARHALMLGAWGLSVASAVHGWLGARTIDFQYAHRPAWYMPTRPGV